ncbi:unnamed protein product [Hydatigera taeniaeformis]|uniref:Deoxyribonuclease II n=1 Tax=Hydatigena taeniaeformis TaxID=6205 RepID=A0A0R3X939_HYDTA|nr:unnamed protein product [Hydatigera taeniaeformis]
MGYFSTLQILLSLQYFAVHSQLGCRDDDNRIVDWHIAYKFPNSFSYAFLSPNDVEWRLSSADLRGNGFLKFTFDQVFNSTDPGLVYGMYNDEMSPTLNFTYNPWYGHMKGLFAFTENDPGFWLSHSVPKLSMKPAEFSYPETSKRYGQHFLCVSLNYSALEAIGMFLFNSYVHCLVELLEDNNQSTWLIA